ncbi:Glycosyltransferase, catalytic subunit of cellulose synthase and poly-beta-1,6-N-acetylglucosamine synthase [Sphingobacterium nematocida]|uniref:Glycosyltransferase, catalytic subunit of cellulose synthase and poly-beta-1,6-N-acetylglucosamine synthase n=1 Tax=Sphingobacterium nematocida TaxID=1513896 RepID=A0A1T5DTJ3_9SPHI|nr:glycosyltransferase [Sphingobacterium nematocida]SKB74899.1 Glycosyltransferase, catalytic subunit of cellulose synthase and poly-beta-1,6-N-acetylglucosamine synthase [Sphingobacterium nematocida]
MRKGWSRIPYFEQNKIIQEKISVLIAARNEEENIARTIECVLSQDFPTESLELIIVDDHSIDRTADIVRSYSDRGVKLLQLSVGDKLNSYKKYAITKAIEMSTGDIIVTTDADCRMGKNWLKTIAQYFETNKSYLVSSPVMYSEEKTHFEELQTLEFMYLIGLGAAGIGNGSPTTCNGANLAYKKAVFYEMDGFKGIENLASGDDELFLHKVAAKYADRIGFCKSTEAIVYTDAKPDLKSFISQRKRWASKSTKYKDKKVVALGVSIWAFNLALLVSLFAFFLRLPEFNWILLTAFGLKIIVEFIFMAPITSFMKRRDLLKYVPILSIVHSFYIVYIGIAGNTGKYDWKGRQVN